MNILKKYFETEAGLTRPSKSIRTLARISYWFYLILGVIAMFGCLIGFLNMLDIGMEVSIMFLLLAAICPFVFKLMGWMSSLTLRAIAVVLESHEKNLDIQSGSTAARAATWTCGTCGRENPKHIGSCSNCGAVREDPWSAENVQTVVKEKATIAAEKLSSAAEKVTSASEKAVSAARKFLDSKPKKENARRSDGWICAQCGASNPAFVGSCNQCGAVKPKK